jgi:hypothetical protein
MNVNQLINIVMKLFVRKAVNGGINAGIRKVSGSGRGGNATQGGAPMDAGQSKQAVRKARQAARAARQLGKM